MEVLMGKPWENHRKTIGKWRFDLPDLPDPPAQLDRATHLQVVVTEGHRHTIQGIQHAWCKNIGNMGVSINGSTPKRMVKGKS